MLGETDQSVTHRPETTASAISIDNQVKPARRAVFGGRSWRYALCGFFLGVLAPIGWVILRLMLFWQPEQGLWLQITSDIFRSWESLVLYMYMGGGTAVVLGLVGYVIGRGAQEIFDRAASLDELNRTVAHQKEEFERRFRDLNHSIKNFHTINAHIQRSSNFEEILGLAAEGLHHILGYDRVNILMVNPDRKTLQFVASLGTGNGDVRGITLPLDDRAGALYRIVQEKQVMLVRDIERMPESYHLKPPCDAIVQLRSRSFIICPIVVRDEVVGLFGVDNKIKRKALDDTDIDTVKLFADQVSAALTKINLLEAVETLIRELDQTFRELLRYREEQQRHNHSLKEATTSTSESIREVAGAADVVREVIDTTRSSAGEISISIEQVSQNLHQLTDFMDKSISAMTEISRTISGVQESAARSHSMSETVKTQAENGVQSVNGALDGLKGISAAVEKTVASISRLSEKGEEIGSITGVINEITQKTNLLSLNAAIIAAQAGEHGRSFGVVADEVRNLALEASRSTSAIAGLIGEIQEFTGEAVAQIGATRKLVQNGVELGENMASSLKQILSSAVLAMDMAHSIRKATQEVSASVESVSVSVEELGEMSAQVSLASREQSQGTKSIVRSVEELKSMAEDLVKAAEQQKRNTREIEQAVAAVSGMAERIFNEMEERQKGSREVIEKLEGLKNLEGH